MANFEIASDNVAMPRDWEAYYSDASNPALEPEALLVQIAELLPPGRALDLACGAGRNAIYLARLGWRVTAVDSSPAAIARLRERAGGLPIEARVADLERGEFPIEPHGYDLICDFYYLQRSLFPEIREGVRPGGMVAAAIHLEGSFALRPGELREEFAGWKVLLYSEGAEAGKAKRAARIMARRA
jgi:SAM-dependent methyltransferase